MDGFILLLLGAWVAAFKLSLWAASIVRLIYPFAIFASSFSSFLILHFSLVFLPFFFNFMRVNLFEDRAEYILFGAKAVLIKARARDVRLFLLKQMIQAGNSHPPRKRKEK